MTADIHTVVQLVSQGGIEEAQQYREHMQRLELSVQRRIDLAPRLMAGLGDAR